MTDDTPVSASRGASRRGFLKAAGTVAASAAAVTVGCAPDAKPGAPSGAAPLRATGFDRTTLDALGEVMLPGVLGTAGRQQAVTAFVAWVDGYDPVAEEMHGYGYSDIRYLPPDPAPAWRAQLAGVDVLARKSRGKAFAQLDVAARQEVVAAALASVNVRQLGDPLGAPHVAVALAAHWARSPGAWDLALGVQVGSGTCRKLDGVEQAPPPVAGPRA